jgi:chromosome segregation ATPase
MAIDETKARSNAIEWLEGEVHQAKAQIGKLQQQAEQLQGQLWRATEEAQRSQEVFAALRVQLEGLNGLQEQVRQLTNEAAIIKEQQTSLRDAVATSQQQQQTVIDGSRRELGQVLKKLDAIEKSVTGAERRANSVEEGQRPLRNDVSALRHSLNELERNLSELQTRSERNLEASKRLEQTLDRVNGDLVMLGKQDEATVERVQLQAEHVRRVEEQVASVLADQTTHEDIFQKMDVLRSENQHVAERVAALEKSLDAHRALIDEEARALDLLGPKLQGQNDRLMELQRQVAGYHDDLLTHLTRWSQLYEKQRRRQISQLEQELRELKQYELKLRPE